MAFNGCRSCTIRSDLPSFFNTQNHRDRYDEFDGWHIPELILSLIISTTLSWMPGGMGIFLSTQGMCSIVGMTTGSKYSLENSLFLFCPRQRPSRALLSNN